MTHINKLKEKLASAPKKVPPLANENVTIYETVLKYVDQIYQFDLSSEIDADVIVNLIYSFRKNYPYSNEGKTNVYAWHSDFFAHKQTSDFNPLIEVIKNKLWKIDPIAQNYPDFETSFKLLESWVGIYKQTEYTVPHDHGPVKYAAVYYAKAEENCSPIVFKTTDKDMSIVPKTNTLVIFSGKAMHYVPKSTSDDDRIIFAANFTSSTLEI